MSTGVGIDLWIEAERCDTDGRWRSITLSPPLYDGVDARQLAAIFTGSSDLRDGEWPEPIAPPRGLPPDLSPELHTWAAAWGRDVHTHGWATLREIADYDWNRVVVRRAVVFANAFAKWDGQTAPPAYARWVLAATDCEIDQDAMRQLVTRAHAADYPLPEPSAPFPTDAPPGIAPHLHCALRTRFTTVQWRETCREACRHFVATTIPRLRGLGPGESVRIVYLVGGA